MAPARVPAPPATGDLAAVRARAIRLVALDVDGTLTDGRLYIGAHDEAMKGFSVRDGFGLNLLARAGIAVAIVTGRRSAIVERRAAELSIPHLLQGVKDKAQAIDDLSGRTGVAPVHMAFMGDDWPDLPALLRVGLPAAVANDCQKCSAISGLKGGSPSGSTSPKGTS